MKQSLKKIAFGLLALTFPCLGLSAGVTAWFTDFDTISTEGTNATTTLTSNGYSLNLPAGVKSTSEGYLDLAEVGASITLPANLQHVSVVLDLAEVPESSGTLLHFELAGGSDVVIYYNGENRIGGCWNNGNNIFTSNATLNNWECADTKVTCVYGAAANSNGGTHVYAENSENALYSCAGLMTTSNGNCQTIYVGYYNGGSSPCANLKLKGIYIYASKLTTSPTITHITTSTDISESSTNYGDIIIAEGATLTIGANTTYSSISGAGTLCLNGATLEIGADYSRAIEIGPNGGTIKNTTTSDLLLSSVITGSGKLTLIGSSSTAAHTMTKDNAATTTGSLAISANSPDFTGSIEIASGAVYVGGRGSSSGGSTTAKIGTGTVTVKSGATFLTHLGGGTTRQTFGNPIVAENGAVIGNKDGHVTYSGTLSLTGDVTYLFGWKKDSIVEGVISGSGTLTVKGGALEGGASTLTLSNNDNTYTGTYTLASTSNSVKLIVAAGAATAARISVETANDSVQFNAAEDTVVGLEGAAGTVTSGGDATVLTVTGSADVSKLTLNKVTLALGDTATVTMSEAQVRANGTTTVASDATLEVVLASVVVECDLSDFVTLNEGAIFNFIDAATGETVTAGTVDGCVYTPALNTWTNKTGDGKWETLGNWSTGAMPTNDTDSVCIDTQGAELTITLASADTLANVKVQGGGTLTIEGAKLTVTDTLTAEASIVANEETLSAIGYVISNGMTVTYTNASTMALPALEGEGTFSKFGTGLITVSAGTACEAHLIMNAGTLQYNEGVDYAKTYQVTVKEGAVVSVSDVFSTLTSGENRFNMEGGSKLTLTNGNSSATRFVRASFLISESTEENPVVIEGSYYGNATNVAGTISGNGVLVLRQNNNVYTVSAVIQDGANEGDALKVKLESGNVTLSGANTYTGGTEIAAGATLTVANANALGSTGNTSGAGTLVLNYQLTGTGNPANIATLNRNGLIDNTKWTGTVEVRNAPNMYLDFASLGNDKSTVRLNGFSGYTAQSAGEGTQMNTNIEIGANGLTINNGNSGNLAIVTGNLSGAGSITMDTSAAPHLVFQEGTGTFTGDIAISGGSATKAPGLIFGSASNATNTNGCYYVTLGSGDASVDNHNPNGKISVAPGATALVVGTWTAAQGVHVAGTIGGTGAIGSDTTSTNLTLADGATLDASNGALTVTGDVTYGDTITIKVPDEGDWTTGVKVLNTATTLPTAYTIKQGDETLSTVMLVAKAGDGVYAVKPTVPEITIDEEKVAVSDSNLAKIQAAAAAAKVQAVTSIEGAVLVPADGDIPAKTVDLAGLELFDNVAVTVEAHGDDATIGTATVSYAFGITSIGLNVHVTEPVNNEGEVTSRVIEYYPIVTAKVSKLDKTEGPTFVNDVKVKLYSGNIEIGEATAEAGKSEVTIECKEPLFTVDSSEESQVNSSDTSALTIKAVKTQQP